MFDLKIKAIYQFDIVSHTKLQFEVSHKNIIYDMQQFFYQQCPYVASIYFKRLCHEFAINSGYYIGTDRTTTRVYVYQRRGSIMKRN